VCCDVPRLISRSKASNVALVVVAVPLVGVFVMVDRVPRGVQV
jgi:hypothetical protein